MILVTSLLWVGAASANGGIVTDGSLGHPSTVLSPGIGGPEQVVIPQSAGQTSGHNLFQSFSNFNISKGQTVTFAEDQKGFVENVIARVTGKETSEINGTLRVTPEGRANFYLLNPNGVLFGNGAQIDVPGDFHVTTASFVKFKDGAKFGADPVASQLSASSPSAFGFSASNHNNNVLIGVSDGANLATQNPGTAIDLVGANIKVEHGGIIQAKQEGSQIRLIAARGGQNITLESEPGHYLPLPNLRPQKNNSGSIDVVDKALVRTSSQGPNKIGGWSYDLNIRNASEILAENHGNQSATSEDGIDWRSARISISDSVGSASGSGIFSQNFGSAQGSSLRLLATQSLSIVNNSAGTIPGIASQTSGRGNSGSVSIHAGQVQMQGEDFTHRAVLQTFASSSGNAGNLTLQATQGIQLNHA